MGRSVKCGLEKELLTEVLCPITDNAVGLHIDGLLVTSSDAIPTSCYVMQRTRVSEYQLMPCSRAQCHLSHPSLRCLRGPQNASFIPWPSGVSCPPPIIVKAPV